MQNLAFDINDFDAVEVEPVCMFPDGTVEVCERGSAEIAFWSVYLHFKEGGVVCIADAAIESMANTIAYALQTTYPHLRQKGETF
jgi:hypothetical protein